MRIFLLSPLIAIFFLTACQRIPIEVPEVKTQEPVEIDDASSLAAIKFDRVGIKIKRGTAIGDYEFDLTGLNCAMMEGNIFWNRGRVLARDMEFADIFYDELKAANFNIIGNPDKMFAGATEERVRPRFLIGGQIDEIKLEVCEQINWWTGYPRGTQMGKGAVKVRWQVFSVLNREVVFETTTQGAAKLDKGVSGGEIVLIHDAFANAVVNLAADKKFVKMLSKREQTIVDIKNVDKSILQIDRYPPREQPITETIDQTRLSVVSIDSGFGHGSGFFIAPELIMTNYHVTGNGQFMRITLLTGRKILGEVIRRHPKRDIAIIQVEKSGHLPIPIRNKPLKIAEEVFAVGSPLDKELSGTVTKGIVSKFTPNRAGMEDIQADVDIQGGNSGGPLLDSKGNVVGISYAGIGPSGQFSSGINFFIPIADALRRLNLKFRKRNQPS